MISNSRGFGGTQVRRNRVPFWESAWLWGIPPSPHPSESLDWRGFRKNGPQNLERLGVRGQNLDFKELTGLFEAAA